MLREEGPSPKNAGFLAPKDTGSQQGQLLSEREEVDRPSEEERLDTRGRDGSAISFCLATAFVVACKVSCRATRQANARTKFVGAPPWKGGRQPVLRKRSGRMNRPTAGDTLDD